jgi:hypothetical protein
VVCLLSLILAGCANRVLLDERFHDTRLFNWMVVDDPDTLEAPSDWRVDPDGWLHQRGNIWGKRGDFIGRWFGTLIVAGDAGWTDYTLSVKAKPTDDDGFGIVFRYQDSEHFYRLLFLQDGLSGGPITRLDRREGQDYTQLWSVEIGYRPGVELTIEVKLDNEAIQVSVDGRRLLDVKDGAYRSGKIGLFCYAQRGQAFDDVRVVKD